MADYNPWNVANATMFLKYCCPECDYQITQLEIFVVHATSNHALSKILFENGELKNEFQIKQEYHDPLEYENYYDNGDQQQYYPEEILEQSLHDDDKTKSKPQFSEDLDVRETKYTNDVELTSNSIEDSKHLLSISEGETKTKVSISIKKCEPKRSKASHFQCSICPEVFKLRKDLNLHMSKTHESKCTFCSKEFDKIKDLWNHENTDHKNIPCDECGKTFKSPKYLRLHKKMHVLRACEFCGKMIVENHMASHINVMHGAVGKSAPTFTCEICPFKTTQKRYLREHKRTRHGPDKVGKKIENYTCHICREIFPYSKFAERSYIQHYRSVHNTECPEYEDMEKFLCEQCPAIYFNKQSLKAHILKSHVNGSKISKQTTCKKCKITFSGRRKYAAHCKEFHDKIVSSFKLVKCKYTHYLPVLNMKSYSIH